MPDKAPFCQPECAIFTKLQSFGWSPATVYDVGSASGWWSVHVGRVFPSATFHLFEPLADLFPKYAADVQRSLPQAPAGATLHKVALTDADGPVPMQVHDNGWGSSLLKMEHLAAPMRTVPGYRLDTYAREHGLPAPDLLKIDTQGNEDAVLRGAGAMLDQCQVLLIETSLLRLYGPKNPLLTELVGTLRERGFRIVNFGNEFYGPRHELLQVDAVFVHDRLLDRIEQASNGWNW